MKKCLRVISIIIIVMVISFQTYAQCLCIYISSFKATRSGCTTIVNWTTQTETGTGGRYLVWRSLNASDWIQVATVMATATPHTYTYNDANPYNPTHGKVYYKVYNIDPGGNTVEITQVAYVDYAGTTCTGTLGSLCGTPSITGFTSPFVKDQTEILSINGGAPQSATWGSSNNNVATVARTGKEGSQGSLKAIATSGSATITATLPVCNISTTITILVGTAPLINDGSTFYFTASVTYGSGKIVAPAGTTVHVNVSSGGPNGPYTTNMSITGATFASGGNNLQATGYNGGSVSSTFVMPAAGYVNWSGSFSEPNSYGSGAISVN